MSPFAVPLLDTSWWFVILCRPCPVIFKWRGKLKSENYRHSVHLEIALRFIAGYKIKRRLRDHFTRNHLCTDKLSNYLSFVGILATYFPQTSSKCRSGDGNFDFLIYRFGILITRNFYSVLFCSAALFLKILSHAQMCANSTRSE